MADKVKKELPDDDDGRTIANMNVEGMPWYVKRPEQPETGVEHTPMTKEQARIYTWAAIKAGLVIVLVFGLIFFLFIAFCDFVWFK